MNSPETHLRYWEAHPRSPAPETVVRSGCTLELPGRAIKISVPKPLSKPLKSEFCSWSRSVNWFLETPADVSSAWPEAAEQCQAGLGI